MRLRDIPKTRPEVPKSLKIRWVDLRKSTLAPLEAHRSAQDGFKLSVRDLNKAFLDVQEAFKTSKMAIGAAFIPLMDRLQRNTALGMSQFKANS